MQDQSRNAAVVCKDDRVLPERPAKVHGGFQIDSEHQSTVFRRPASLRVAAEGAQVLPAVCIDFMDQL